MATRNRNESAIELRKEVVRSREQLAHDLVRFRDEVDLSKKIKRSFQRQPVIWIAAMAAAGAGAVILLTRKKKIRVDSRSASAPKNGLLQAGFLLGALRIAASLLKPQIEAFLAQKIRNYGGGRREK
ncbi:MAG TPA: hypothetical protein VEI58_06105 [Chthoniobacterales bacterium]|nr:hypothetical protein [Chthoniobacterales bacterium]